MKTLFVLAVATLIAAPAFARSHKSYTIDMTGKKFTSGGFNTMDDSMASDFDGMQIKLSGKINEDFDIKVEASNPAEAKDCSIDGAHIIGNTTFVEISAAPDTDSGDTCDFTVQYTNGKKAVLKVESTGT